MLRPLTVCLLSMLVLSGCYVRGDEQPKVSILEAANIAASSAPVPYRITVGDELEIRFFYTSELDQIAVVRPDGRISMQLIGSVQAAGKVPEDLRDELRERFRSILKRPEIAVTLRRYAPQRVFVGGEVAKPGELALDGPTSLLQAVVRAGGFTADAQRDSVLLLRYNGDAPVRVYRLDIDRFLQRAQHPQSLEPAQIECPLTDGGNCDSAQANFHLAADAALQPFDVIYVPQTVVATVADFFNRYVNAIVPFYRNFGLTLSYDLNPEVRITE